MIPLSAAAIASTSRPAFLDVLACTVQKQSISIIISKTYTKYHTGAHSSGESDSDIQLMLLHFQSCTKFAYRLRTETLLVYFFEFCLDVGPVGTTYRSIACCDQKKFHVTLCCLHQTRETACHHKHTNKVQCFHKGSAAGAPSGWIF